MHLDESTVAWFGWQLATGHGYAYDPVYHGPFQHEVLALIFLLFQSSETSARMIAVVLGTGIVILPWFIRDYLGKVSSLLCSCLLAISPSFLYFARFERDDTYMEFFTFLMVVFALRFFRDRHPAQLFGFAVALALAFATKESIYIVAFIFGSYAVLWIASCWIQRAPIVQSMSSRWNGRLPTPILAAAGVVTVLGLVLTIATGLYLPVPLIVGLILCSAVLLSGCERRGHQVSSLISSSKPYTLSAITLACGILVLMYSTFGTNLNGLWDSAHPFLNSGHSCPYPLAFHLDACRKDLVGGLFYWLSQHKVARGGQPWNYYLLLYGLYEQIPIIFGSIGVIVVLVNRRLSESARSVRLFFVYWAIAALIIYSWAGEKFPWLGIHPLLPLTVVAAIALGDLVKSRPRGILRGSGLGLAALLVLVEAHNAFTLNFVDGANPVEMMVYVQSAPDTPRVSNQIESLSNQIRNSPNLPVTIDANESWPFAWYLRNMPDVAYPSGNLALKPPYVSNPILIIDQGDALTYGIPRQVARGYTKSHLRLDWWFPENYKLWDWRTFFQTLLRPSTWRAFFGWELFRKPFGPRDGTWYYLFVKKGYFSPY